MKFCSLVLELHLPQNFCHTHTDRHTDRQTDRHFPEIVKSCSGHPKTCKSIKNRKSKIFTKHILSSSYTDESKKLLFRYFRMVTLKSMLISSKWAVLELCDYFVTMQFVMHMWLFCYALHIFMSYLLIIWTSNYI